MAEYTTAGATQPPPTLSVPDTYVDVPDFEPELEAGASYPGAVTYYDTDKSATAISPEETAARIAETGIVPEYMQPAPEGARYPTSHGGEKEMLSGLSDFGKIVLGSNLVAGALGTAYLGAGALGGSLSGLSALSPLTGLLSSQRQYAPIASQLALNAPTEYREPYAGYTESYGGEMPTTLGRASKGRRNITEQNRRYPIWNY